MTYSVKFSRAVSSAKVKACQILTDRMMAQGVLGVWVNAVTVGTKQKQDDPNAVGRTWEHINGIKANSKPGPDEHIGKIGFEHKAGLLETSSLGTLFCKEADGRGSNRATLETYHQWSTDEQRYGLYATITVGRETNIDGHVFQLSTDNKSLMVTVNGNPFVEWSAETMTTAAKNKLNHIVVRVKAEERYLNGQRQFRYSQLSYHTDFDFDNLLRAFEVGEAAIDYRAHFTGEKLKSGKDKIRNHGTAVRMVDAKIPSLFGAHAHVDFSDAA